MKRRLGIVFLVITMAVISSCVRDYSITMNFGAKKYFDSWVKVHCPDAKMTKLGAYIMEDEPGTGVLVGDVEEHPYIYLTYKTMDLDGNIADYTDSTVAKQMHEFNNSTYYGPKVLSRLNNNLNAGFEDVIKDMRVGGKRKAVVPGWLSVTDRYSTAQEYLDKCTGDDVIYELEIVDAVLDITQAQIDSIERYLSHNLHKTDSTAWGFYYIQTCPPTDTTSFKPDDAVYINYTGRLLNGKVFDTSVKDTAKRYGLDLAGSYNDIKIKIAENYTDYTMGDGNSGGMIDGFSYCLSRMRTGEKGIAVFTSNHGYQGNDSEKIPAFSPLRFDIEMIGKK